MLSGGQASDMTAVPELLGGLPAAQAVVADRGYDSNAVLELIARSGAKAAIPSCSRRDCEQADAVLLASTRLWLRTYESTP
jgi:IS5 family transposase